MLLSSSLPTGGCFVMTANLDGETNLKPLSAARETRGQAGPELLDKLQAQVLPAVLCCLHCSVQVECQNPSPDLLSFKGRVRVERAGGETEVASLSCIVLLYCWTAGRQPRPGEHRPPRHPGTVTLLH